MKKSPGKMLHPKHQTPTTYCHAQGIGPQVQDGVQGGAPQRGLLLSTAAAAAAGRVEPRGRQAARGFGQCVTHGPPPAGAAGCAARGGQRALLVQQRPAAAAVMGLLASLLRVAGCRCSAFASQGAVTAPDALLYM